MFIEYPLVIEQYLKMSTMLVRFRIGFDAHWIQLCNFNNSGVLM